MWKMSCSVSLTCKTVIMAAANSALCTEIINKKSYRSMTYEQFHDNYTTQWLIVTNGGGGITQTLVVIQLD